MKIAAMLGILMVMSLGGCSGNSAAETYSQVRQTEQSTQIDSHIINTAYSESPVSEAVEEVTVQETTTHETITQTDISSEPEADIMDRIVIQVGADTFTATLNGGAAAKEFAARLPLTLSMSELHGNEKYYYLEQSLPTASEAVGSIRSGDLMLFGADCLVLFYEDFSTSYSYTRLGSIDDPSGLAEALGRGGVEITFLMEQ